MGATQLNHFCIDVVYNTVDGDAGKRDELCIYPVAKAAAAKAKQATLVTYDCVHFDIYNSPWFEKSLRAQLDFLKKHAV